jgi:hypothetical protein
MKKQNYKSILKSLSFWKDKTDEDCIQMATSENAIDAEQALINLLN